MAKQTRTYHGITRASFNDLRASLAEHDMRPTGDAGSFPAPHGFTVSWVFNEAQSNLTVTLDGSAFLIGLAWNMVDGGIHPHATG